MAYISLCFKVIVVLVFWKDSRDFRKIIRGREQANDNPDNELDDILANLEN